MCAHRKFPLNFLTITALCFSLIGCSTLGMRAFERRSLRLYEQLLICPCWPDSYNVAMQFYIDGRYWDAAFEFGKLLSLYPNYYINDKTTFYLGDCFIRLRCNGIAREILTQALKDYPTSPMRGNFVWGLELLDYREGKFDEALQNHAFIENLYPESDIHPAANYYAAQIYLNRGYLTKARELLTCLSDPHAKSNSSRGKNRKSGASNDTTTIHPLPGRDSTNGGIYPGSPYYPFAQYTLSVVNIELGNRDAAIADLLTIVNDSAGDESSLLLRDAANLKLGHLYFERGDHMREAVQAYGRVREGSSYQDEALLASAWVWMKANRPEEAIRSIDRLLSIFSESPYVPESWLLKGYALMSEKKFGEAIESIEDCKAACNRHYTTDEVVRQRHKQMEEIELQFAPVAQQIKKNALKKPTQKTVDTRPELEREYLRYADECDAYFQFTLATASDNRFLLNKDSLLAKSDHALHIAVKLQERHR
jgi:tetratricopeptide (TPR) repeat protein